MTEAAPERIDLSAERPSRVAIERVAPCVDAGRFPIKRVVGESVEVTAAIHTDGHDQISAVLLHRAADSRDWTEIPMEERGNDIWAGAFTVDRLGVCEYSIVAWVDPFRTWRRGLLRKADAGAPIGVEFLIGASMVDEAAHRASPAEAESLRGWAEAIRKGSDGDVAAALAAATDQEWEERLAAVADRAGAATLERPLRVRVDPSLARSSAWYELFPRSASPEPGRHGTLRDVADRLAYVKEMGFNVLYLPPIHPIGRTARKGRNGSTEAAPDDPGSPWAIGAREGGHRAIHPELGTLEEFRAVVGAARGMGIEVAIDLAFQCSPDHPYLREHPEWFRRRPDGTIQYAENPPKKYQDIVPFDFDCADWRGLWEELRGVVFFWIEQGVRVLRVDNPHTKPYPFWEWMIASVKEAHPETIFLSEAFTRPSVMARLAKVGFTQSYTYFAWRSTARDLRSYLTELTRTEVAEYLRPNLWPNTPDILTEELQAGGRPAFIARFALAATLGASYGIYGPAFELCESRPLEEGREEYLDSEKYQIRHWDWERRDSLRHLIARVNRIREENPALQTNRRLWFLTTTNDRLLAYAKQDDAASNAIVAVVNLEPHHTHSGFVEVPMEPLGLDPSQPYQVHDLLSEARYLWHGARNYVELRRDLLPVQIFRIRRRLRTERDFDYYL